MILKNLLLETSKNKNIVTILDIGSSKIVCLIAKISGENIEIIGNGCHSANGFKNGNISDSKLAKASIISAVDQAEKVANVTIDKVILALNGNKITSHYLVNSTVLKNQKVDNSDVNYLISNGIKDLEKEGREVIHYFSLGYDVDDNRGIKNPCGLLGKKLSANLHFITIPSTLLDNIVNCLAACQLNVEDCVFAPYAAGLATLGENDKEFGATVIDFGDGITSYALFSQNNIVNCGFIPIGSRSITNDIAKSFMLDFASAERIKTIHGAASVSYADNQKMIRYKTEGNIFGNLENEDRNISNVELNEVINARVNEIFSLLKSALDKQYKVFADTQHNIVLTGGGSLLTGVGQEVSRTLSSKVRLGKTAIIPGVIQDHINSTYSVAIGVLQYLSLSSDEESKSVDKNSFLGKIVHWIKNKL